MADKTRVALSLGSGGARGYAHIGAIQVLRERDYEIVSVAGSSMGAVVGALHAVDRLDEYTEWVRELSQLDVLRLLDLSLSSPGMIRAERVFARVHELIGDTDIEDLPIPFTAVATDLLARRAVWFQRGPVDVALRASVAIPGMFAPVMLNGRMLVDGGVIDPVPVAPTASTRADVVLAVDLGGERATTGTALGDGSPALESASERPAEEWMDRFRRGASQLLDRDAVRAVLGRFGGGDGGADVEKTTATDDLGAATPVAMSRFDVMNQSIEAMQSVVTRYRLAGNPPDILVTVPKDSCRALDFHRANELIAIGRTLTTEALDAHEARRADER